MAGRRAAKVDANQAEIVRTLRRAGVSVQSLATVGEGCPDLLCGYHGINFLLEVKDGAKKPSARKLTEDEQEWHANWRGTVLTVKDDDEALLAVRAVAAGL